MMDRQISITKDNRLYIVYKGAGRIFDFNQNYCGYFPELRWTASCANDHAFYVAGTDGEGIPYLFSSLTGEIWTKEGIEPVNGLFQKEEYGDIVSILWDEGTHQFYLVSWNGYLIALPDCPKCVRVRIVSEQKLREAWIGDRILYIREENGGIRQFYMETIAQYRCAWDFAKPHLHKDGILIDLRPAEEQREAGIPGAYGCEGEALEKLLVHYPKDRYLFFVCEHGYQADAAAREARDSGIQKSYSLGGIYELGK